ncbi:MAG: hypothetical protein IJG45_01175 [Oscillospiraceae bacterium]|nr:hypothetical protein [Oscillospiraceae bacterium]
MSIPFYFAMEENEAAQLTGSRYAQLGFGFHADGTVRFPKRILPDAPAVINDRFLPAAAPEAAVLDRLASACGSGCFLDFERPINEVGAAIALGLKRRLKAKMTVPPALHALLPDAYVQIPGRLCNCWEKYVRRVQEKYRDQWVLEIIPWSAGTTTGLKRKEEFYLETAQCSCRVENGKAIYHDTKASIQKKLALAERYGCQAGIVLLREYRQCID